MGSHSSTKHMIEHLYFVYSAEQNVENTTLHTSNFLNRRGEISLQMFCTGPDNKAPLQLRHKPTFSADKEWLRRHQ